MENKEKNINKHIKIAQYSVLKKIGYLLYIWVWLIIFLPVFVITVFRDGLTILGFLIGFNIFYIFYCIAILSINQLNKHFNMYDVDTEYWYFEGDIIYRLIYAMGFLPFFIIFFTAYGNPLLGITISLVFFTPALIFFHRKECFSENSLIINGEKPDLSIESNYVEVFHLITYITLRKDSSIIGYDSKLYYFPSIIIGLLVIAFPMYLLTETNITVIGTVISIIWIIIGIFMFYKYFFPDYWNKKINKDIRIKKGFNFYTFVYIIISIAYAITLYILTQII